MPQFNPGEEVVALATFPTKPAGLACTAELWLASNMTKVATSGEIPFTATGGDKSISLPITLPSVEGTYPVYLYVFSNGQRIAAFLGDEEVVIVAPAPLPFTFSNISVSGPTCPIASAYLIPDFSGRISNPGDVSATHTIKFIFQRYSKTYNEFYSPRIYDSFSKTLNPGEFYDYSYYGFFLPPGEREPVCDPILMRHSINYFWLEDELGNKSDVVSINIP